MINKLLANISYNPSLIEELSFYAKRLKREESVRKAGLIMIVLSMIVQVFAVNFPAEKSLASSSNHIINGVQTKSDLLRAWDDKNSDVADIYGKFGVTRQDIANLSDRPNDTIYSNANNYWSIGRHSLSGYSTISGEYKDEELAIETNGPTVYLRKLQAWGTAAYPSFKGKNSTTGETFWIIADCGNYTQLGKGRPPKPELEIKKSVVGNKKKFKPGDELKFRIEYRNKQKDSLAEDVVLTDKLDRGKFEVVESKGAKIGKDDKLEKKIGNLQHTKNSRVYDIQIKLSKKLKDGQKICNIAKIISGNANGQESNQVCITIETPPDKPPSRPPEKPPVIPPPDIPPKTPPEIPPGLSKEVSNISQKLRGDAAVDSTAKPGDVIEYKLITTNSGPKEITNFEVRDDISDILEYANLDEEFLASQGGVYDEARKHVVWSRTVIPSSSEVSKTFRVQIKSVTPSTNSPSNSSTSYDCKISNEYGDEVTMGIECPLIKTVETLPNTGPGATIAFTFAATSISGYFFARSRLLGKEAELAKQSLASTGAPGL